MLSLNALYFVLITGIMKIKVPDVRKPGQNTNPPKSLKGKFLNKREIEIVNGNFLLSHALYYASQGFPVFPAHCAIGRKGYMRCSCREGADCSFPAKHPRTHFGLNEATTNKRIIRDWWGTYPNANIGLATGRKHGFFVFDIDIKNGGEESFEILQDDYRELLGKDYEPIPPTLIAHTGSGGRHLFFNYPEDVRIIGSESIIAPGIDIRSDGNYVIAPPSNHKSGGCYSWFYFETEIENAPDWLIVQIITAKADESENKRVLGPASTLTGEIMEEGDRNSFLFRHGCGLVNSFPSETVAKRLHELNQALCSPPLSDREVERTLAGIDRNYRGKKSGNIGIKE